MTNQGAVQLCADLVPVLEVWYHIVAILSWALEQVCLRQPDTAYLSISQNVFSGKRHAGSWCVAAATVA